MSADAGCPRGGAIHNSSAIALLLGLWLQQQHTGNLGLCRDGGHLLGLRGLVGILRQPHAELAGPGFRQEGLIPVTCRGFDIAVTELPVGMTVRAQMPTRFSTPNTKTIARRLVRPTLADANSACG